MSAVMNMDRITAAEFRRREGLSPAVATDIKPQIRLPRAPKMNKTEVEWLEYLRRKYVPAESYRIMYEPFTLLLPSGTRYTPDFVVLNENRVLAVYETKGAHIHSAASIRAFKEACSAFPFWSFCFAQKTKGGWATT